VLFDSAWQPSNNVRFSWLRDSVECSSTSVGRWPPPIDESLAPYADTTRSVTLADARKIRFVLRRPPSSHDVKHVL
jgi:hypothetical protein